MEDRFKLNLFNKKESPEYISAQEITENVYLAENLTISLFPVDFSKEVKLNYRKELTKRWIEVLPKLDTVQAISIRHHVDQDFLEAICEMKNLKRLNLWSSSVTDISPLKNLARLDFLHLDSCNKLIDISPVQYLENLELLSISNSFKVSNYESIGQCVNLIGLALNGNQFSPKKLRLNSLRPFINLKKLKHLDLTNTTVSDNSYDILLELVNLERFDTTTKIPVLIREKINEHPKLTAGFFVDWDWDNDGLIEGKEW
ncbi:hypothetical protein NF867_14610 [Solitalea sp. MAHUQ-68]|uniref:Leucine-rich repeat domain-containing protein n=1 Tax=Solitalea agri TaxID=2953739 RepID=A0A9X2F3I5_9SPHI|nr:leucine-rich repeat domain-containing protein [Solitalea agri]MCO4294092.1 hypothetical protein [Solitalea agri]